MRNLKNKIKAWGVKAVRAFTQAYQRLKKVNRSYFNISEINSGLTTLGVTLIAGGVISANFTTDASLSAVLLIILAGIFSWLLAALKLLK